MHPFKPFLPLAILASATLSHAAVDLQNDPLRVISLTAPDGSARADFIPYGATAISFWTKDKFGKFRDVMLGFDDVSAYQTDALGHPFFGVVGRYANRIRNGTFTIPPTKNASGPNKYHVPLNENNVTALHGGNKGFDRRVWNVFHQTKNSVSFTMVDPDGEQGFPGTVISTVKYTLLPEATWTTSIQAIATEKTPILLSGHNYWNLEAYKESADLVGHHAKFQSSKFVATDGILNPTGRLTNVGGTPMDFRKAKSIGGSINATAEAQYCGTGCTGFDNAWVYDKKGEMSLWSVNSGIKLDITTDQPVLQIYTCNGIYNAARPIPRKASQGGPSNKYENHSCLVIEQESYIDAINNPEFGVDQIYGPNRPYKWEATYKFSVRA